MTSHVQENPNKINYWVLIRNNGGQKVWHNQSAERKNFQSRILYLAKLPFKKGGEKRQWHHQDGNIVCSSTHYPKQHGQDTTERILEHGGEAKTPPCTTEIKTDHIRRVRGMATGWPLCSSPRPVKKHVKKSPLSLRFLQGEKKAQAWHLAPPTLQVTL